MADILSQQFEEWLQTSDYIFRTSHMPAEGKRGNIEIIYIMKFHNKVVEHIFKELW